MRYVTVQMICKHAGKSRSAVGKAIRNAQVKTERKPGVNGIRITEKEANRLLAFQWPEVGPITPQLATA